MVSVFVIALVLTNQSLLAEAMMYERIHVHAYYHNRLVQL